MRYIPIGRIVASIGNDIETGRGAFLPIPRNIIFCAGVYVGGTSAGAERKSRSIERCDRLRIVSVFCRGSIEREKFLQAAHRVEDRMRCRRISAVLYPRDIGLK